ncbi:hypothetical protein [Anaerobutyricum hallii]|uniref:hypothetical protein n=1 Tax=Anaerobutyricum hallii TaxID=39488 RepID=UPI003520DEB8
MSFNLDNELDLNFDSSSLADDLEGFVKNDTVQESTTEYTTEPTIGDFSKDDSEEPTVDDFSKEDESDEIDSLLDDKLNQIFSTEDFDDDFEQSAEEQNVDKYYQEDDVNLESVIDESTYAEIKYPCLLLNGASTNEEVDFLRSFSTEKNNSKAIYLYCEAAQGVCEIGYIKLTLKFLLTLSRMPGYRLYSLYSDTSERNEIKLDDPEVLSNFISL